MSRPICRLMLSVAILSMSLAPGCALMQAPPGTSAGGAGGPAADENGWLTKTRRQFADASRAIKADLDLHETEGLEQFAPDALDQVNAMRGEMNGTEGISR